VARISTACPRLRSIDGQPVTDRRPTAMRLSALLLCLATVPVVAHDVIPEY
jgi:hypothetical protein